MGTKWKNSLESFPIYIKDKMESEWVPQISLYVTKQHYLVSVTIIMITSTRSFSSSSTEMDPVSFFAVILFNASLQSYALKHWASYQNLLTVSFISNNISSFKHGYETNLPDLKEYFLSSK